MISNAEGVISRRTFKKINFCLPEISPLAAENLNIVSCRSPPFPSNPVIPIGKTGSKAYPPFCWGLPVFICTLTSVALSVITFITFIKPNHCEYNYLNSFQKRGRLSMARRISSIIYLILILMTAGCGYNTIQTNEEAVKAAWGDVEAAYQRRNDLIPNLVEVVKGYAAHERETLTAVTEARAKVGSIQMNKNLLEDPAAFSQFQNAQGAMSSALSRLMVVVERYPDLKANQNFQDLQHQLEGTENRINVARVRYNKAVEVFNGSIRVFPNNLTNKFILGLKLKEPFKAEAGAEKAPKVKF
jgi:LemA protein